MNKETKIEVLVSKNIWQKLIEVKKKVPYIKKGAKSYSYTYTKESQIFGAINEEMNKQGLWLDMDVLSATDAKVAIYNPKDKKVFTVDGIRYHFLFTITNTDNPKETITRNEILQDSGSDVKTIGGLKTYGMKYFLLKFFNIPNDDLDPDKFEKAIESSTTKSLSDAQIQEVALLINGDKEAWKMLKDKFGYDKVSAISQDKYESIVLCLNRYNINKEQTNRGE